MTRIEQIRKALEGRGDAVLVTSESNRFYASGFRSSDGFLLISRTEAVLYLDFRYFEMAKIAKEAGKLQPEVTVVQWNKKRREHLREFLSEHAVKTLLVEDRAVTMSQADALRGEVEGIASLSGCGSLLETCRMQKDEDELSRIRTAQSITDAAFSHILSYLRPGITETDIALELEFFMRKNGAESTAFPTICVSGKKSSLPHGVPENVPVSKGFLTMDFGAKYRGYCADMTRTVCIGEPTEKMRHVYRTVLDAQSDAFNAIFAGVSGCAVDKAARDRIEGAGYKGCFGHSTGHSLGIDIHEAPNFSANNTSPVPENAVLSVEPGVYLEGEFGVRIEDIVKISPEGFENFTKSPKDLIIL